LMTALHRAGRSAEALATFRRARALLREELGTEPGSRLRQVHRAVLRGDPALGVAGGAVSAGAGSRTVPTPRELPAEASWFVGRTAEAARVRRVLGSAGVERRRPVVVLLYGPGGVGKSALAARVGHEVAGAFADGQVYVDLCGSTPGMRPLSAADVLGRLLRSLGVDPREIPSEVADAAALLRSVAAGRRLLVVLDNAADAEQVVPVLPASGSCAVLVTSRHPLPVLDVDDRLRLQGLPEADSVRLLAGLAGDREVEPEAAQAIVAATGGLPLAVRVAGGRLAARPDLSAAEYAERLADDSRRLDELALDRLDVRSCIRVAYDALTGGDAVARRAALAFRTLGVLHVPDVAPGVVAAMLDERDVALAEAALDRLVAVQLLEPVPGGRYRLHDLVRLVATELATEHDSQPDRDDIFARALAYYLGGMKHAEDVFSPGRMLAWGDPPPLPNLAIPSFEGPDSARMWVESELAATAAAFEQACARGAVAPPLAWMGGTVWNNLDRRCEWRTAQRLSLTLLKHAERNEDSRATGFACLLLGRCEVIVGEPTIARTHFQRALQLMKDIGDGKGEALVRLALGYLAEMQGKYVASLEHYGEALELAQREKLHGLMAGVLINMSAARAGIGEMDAAFDSASRSARLSRSRGDMLYLANSLTNLAAICSLRGEYFDALRLAGEALALHEQLGNWLVVCETLLIKSEILRRMDCPLAAANDVDEALAEARHYGYRYVEVAASVQQARICGEQHGTEPQAVTIGEPGRPLRKPDTLIELLLNSASDNEDEGPLAGSSQELNQLEVSPTP
jgi:tetratricopeptide (TPR) repeat protein